MKKTLVFKVAETSFNITFPNNRQFVQIQNAKATLSSNYDLLGQMDAESALAQKLVDVEAYLTILCPDFIKSLTKSFGELSMEEGQKLIVAFNDQFLPWYNENLALIFNANKTDETTTTTTIIPV